MPQITVSADYTMPNSPLTVFVDASGGPVTIYAPAGHTAGVEWFIKDKLGYAETNLVRFQPQGGDLTDGKTEYDFTTDRQALRVVSDGSGFVQL